jgi:hypothetical protein
MKNSPRHPLAPVGEATNSGVSMPRKIWFPVYDDSGTETGAVLTSAYQCEEGGYDGWKNWIRIRPILKPANLLGPVGYPLGSFYQVGHRWLDHLRHVVHPYPNDIIA